MKKLLLVQTLLFFFMNSFSQVMINRTKEMRLFSSNEDFFGAIYIQSFQLSQQLQSCLEKVGQDFPELLNLNFQMEEIGSRFSLSEKSGTFTNQFYIKKGIKRTLLPDCNVYIENSTTISLIDSSSTKFKVSHELNLRLDRRYIFGKKKKQRCKDEISNCLKTYINTSYFQGTLQAKFSLKMEEIDKISQHSGKYIIFERIKANVIKVKFSGDNLIIEVDYSLKVDFQP